MMSCRRLPSRPVGGLATLLSFLAVSCLAHCLALVLRYPHASKGTRSLSFSFVAIWAARNGVPGGVLATLAVDRKPAGIVRVIVDLGRRLDFAAVAVGIEDSATMV